MDTQANIDSTVNEFENEFNRFFDEKMRTTKEELTNWIVTKLRQKLAENLELLKGLDEEFYKVRNERDECIKESIAAGIRFGNRGGSLKKKENDNKLTKKKLIKKRQKQRGRTRRRKYF